MEFTPDTVKALSDMLIPKDEDQDSDSDIDDKPVQAAGKIGPGQIGPAKKQIAEQKVEGPKKNSKDIWDEEEVPEGSEFDTTYDPRPEPEYEILFKQAVTSEDMFLQMGNKTPATSSCEDMVMYRNPTATSCCEDMVVKIMLPETKAADMTVDVKKKFLDLRTPKYKLGLHLPHPVDDKTGKAQWDSKKETLSITLRMVREYDLFNF